MNAKQTLQLILLAAIWGGGFMLLRVAVPEFGAWWLAELRGLVAALVMAVVMLLARQAYALGQHARHFFWLGLFNLALPYVCFSFGAQFLPAAYLALLNATSPLFTALWAAGWDGVPFTHRKVMGMLLGLVGVGVLVGLGPIPLNPSTLLAVGVVLLAPLSYGFAGNYIRKFTGQVGTTRLVAGTQAVAALLLLPLACLMGLPAASTASGLFSPSGPALVAVLLMGSVVTAYGFMLFYQLVTQAGPERAMTVTYLMPVCAMLWGWAVLGEGVTAIMLLGCAIVLTGTYLILRPARVKTS
jgi:drug/metabolite transporter (DMT)-like permease